MLVVFFVAMLCFAQALGAFPTFNETFKKLNPDTVDALDVSKYVGLWYQMSADQIVYSTFEKDAYCCTALYGDNGELS